MSQRSRRGKRRQDHRHHHANDQEETVDDLAYAASFAMMTSPQPSTEPLDDNAKVPTKSDDTTNEDVGADSKEENDDIDIDIDIDESDDGDNDGDGDGDSKVVGEPKPLDENDQAEDDEEEEDDDDEDHEELVKAIAAMEHDVVEEEAEGISKDKSLKTQNEVDAYTTPIHELEQHLQFRLTVDDDSNQNPQATTESSRKLQASDLKCAGTIKHHMVSDRTMVIESNPPIRGQSFNLLDEGTLLLIKGGGAADGPLTHNTSLIPLGRILETFGPVSRPLYTIRLAEPTKPPPSTETTEKKKEETSPPDTTPTNGNNEEQPTDEEKTAENEDPKSDGDNTQTIQNAESSSSTDKAPPLVDNWGPNGKYSQVIQKAQGSSNSSVAVYFVEDEAKLIDTDLIMRISGKGCDASNVYDEEVLNRDEMYYSDDEKERQAKSRRKGSRNQQARAPPQHQAHATQQVVPKGFHQSKTPAGFYAAAPGMARRPMPQGFQPAGFHGGPPPPPMPPQGFQPAGFHGGPPPRPMPPQGFHPTPGPAAPYQQYHPSYGYPGRNPPPPPPPPSNARNGPPPPQSGPPPAYHY